jgi:hypothetical protein
MRQKAFLLMPVVIIFALASISFPPTLTVQAEELLQEVPRLDGYRVYFSESQAEASRFDRSSQGVSRFAGLLQILGAELYTLDWNKDIPPDADMVVMVGPTADLSPEQSARLWSYINSNGRVLLLAEPLIPRIRDGVHTFDVNRALPGERGFFQLTWADLGIRARDDVVVTEGDMHTVLVPVEEEDAPPLQVEMPMLVFNFTTDNVDAVHPITRGFDSDVAFFGARSIEFDASIQPFETTPLVFSGSEFYGEMSFAQYLADGIAEYNIGTDVSRGPKALAAAVENPRLGTRMVVIGDRDFITNGGGFITSPPFSAGFVYPGNVRFILNSVVWLMDVDSEDTVELAFPTAGPTVTPTVTPTLTPTATPEPPVDESAAEDDGDDS